MIKRHGAPSQQKKYFSINLLHYPPLEFVRQLKVSRRAASGKQSKVIGRQIKETSVPCGPALFKNHWHALQEFLEALPTSRLLWYSQSLWVVSKIFELALSDSALHYI